LSNLSGMSFDNMDGINEVMSASATRELEERNGKNVADDMCGCVLGLEIEEEFVGPFVLRALFNVE